MQFYAYRLMIRERHLFSLYCVDMMAKMIFERLNYISPNQQQLRADDYIHLKDALNQEASPIKY